MYASRYDGILLRNYHLNKDLFPFQFGKVSARLKRNVEGNFVRSLCFYFAIFVSIFFYLLRVLSKQQNWLLKILENVFYFNHNVRFFFIFSTFSLQF